MKTTGTDFIKNTYYPCLSESLQQHGMTPPPPEPAPPEDARHIHLPRPDAADFPSSSFAELAEQRRSLRKYAETPLSIEKFSYLLWYTQGVQKQLGNSASLRTVPSAGARHALDTYLLINNVESIPPGLYRFMAYTHSLIACDLSDDIADKICEGCLGQQFTCTAAATFIWVADVLRMSWRYSERSFRYLHLDVGHVCQNLYLAAESIDCGACGIAAFNDEAMNTLTQCDGEDRFVIYCATVGKKES